MSDNQEFTPDGTPIYKHAEKKRVPEELVPGDEELIEAISSHIEKHLGQVDSVLHELISDLVHIDVHIIKPTDEKPFYTLVTSGMSESPMKVPVSEDSFDLSYAELMIFLPPDWKLDRESFEDEANYWPVRWLKMLARMPHEYDTFLAVGHTIPNGDPGEPLADNTKLMGFIMLPPVSVPEEGHQLKISDDKVVEFLLLCPLYEDEMNLKLSKGLDALLEGFDHIDLSPIVDINRPSAAHAAKGKRWWWPF